MALSKALYFIAIIPPKEIAEEVLQMKLKIKEKFGVKHALKLPAHITIVPPFWLETDQEKELFRKINVVATETKSTEIELKNFGRFGQRVIFINVVDHVPLIRLHKNLIRSLEAYLPPEKDQNLHPHITLATRDLTRQSFKEVWQEFKDLNYQARFCSNALTLFKHNGKSWDALEIFSFSE